MSLKQVAKRGTAYALVAAMSVSLLTGCGNSKKDKKTDANKENTKPVPEVVTGNDLSYDGYTEVWKDEFDGDSLNRDDWNVELHNPGWVNEELQAYVDSEENIYVKDGVLCLNPVKDGDKYTSGRVNTQGKHDFKYGLFEAVAKVPEGMGYLPAFWLMPTDENLYGQWPKCGEIDAMEVMGQETSTLHGTIHYGEPHNQSQGTYESKGASFSEAFHTFSVEWEPDKITWYVDGIKYHEENDWFTAVKGDGEVTYPAPFDQPFYMILNLAVGGSWVGYPDETTSFDNNPFMIDSVKVYRKDDSYYQEKEDSAVKPAKNVEVREPDENGNYLLNADFSTGIKAAKDWILHLESDGKDSTAEVADNQIVITPSKEGSVFYSVQLKQEGIPLFTGAEYEVKFEACATEDRTIILDVEGPDNGWIRYYEDTPYDITTEMKEYSFTFTMEEDSDMNSSLEFNLGAQGSVAPVTIRNVSLKQVGGEATGGSGKKVRANGNYIYNGAFQEGDKRLGFWDIPETAADKVYVTNVNNDRRLVITADDSVSEASPITISQNELPMVDGKYALSFNAGCEEGSGTVKMTVGKESFTDSVDSDKDKVYEHKFAYAAGDGDTVTISITAPGTYYIDNVFLGEDALVKNGSFNAGMAGFTQYTYDSAKSEYTVDSLSEDNAFAVTIYDTGTEDWHVQLFQDGVNLEQGKTYRLTFDAKSTMDRGIKCALQHNGSQDDVWDAYHTPISAELTSEYQTFTTEFTMEAATDPVARLDFSLGKIKTQITENHSIFIDNIVLEEI